jgi:hypothetical protein
LTASPNSLSTAPQPGSAAHRCPTTTPDHTPKQGQSAFDVSRQPMEGNEPASSAWKSGHIRYRASCLTGFTWKAGPWRMAVSASRHDRSCCVAPLFCAEGPHEFPAAQGWLVLPHRTFSDRLTALRCCSLAVLEPLVRTCEVPTNQEAETRAAFLATRQHLVRPTRWTSTKRRQRATGPIRATD